jgi:hypothetical protein
MTEPASKDAFAEIGRLATAMYEAYSVAGRNFLKAVSALTEQTQDDYTLVPDPIEEEVTAAIEEPEGFGSIVRAVCLGGSERQLWQRSYGDGKHYWESETGVVDVWSDLTHVEVLRVGIGEPAAKSKETLSAYDEGYGNGQYTGFDQALEAAHARIASLRSVAITAERKDAYDQSLRVVHELRP